MLTYTSGGSHLDAIGQTKPTEMIIDAKFSYYTLVQCHQTKQITVNEAARW